MVKRILILFLSLLIGLPAIKAQQDAALSHYFMATAYYNPAAAGNSEDLKMLALFNQQMTGGFEDVSAFQPTNDRIHSVGTLVFCYG